MEIEAARKILLDHSKHPRNKVSRDSKFEHMGECKNPVCGDHVKVYIEYAREQVQNIEMQVKACTICTASASLMSENIKLKSKDQILKMKTDFEKSLFEHGDSWPAGLESLTAFRHLRENPARIPCALIAWIALGNAMSMTM